MTIETAIEFFLDSTTGETPLQDGRSHASFQEVCRLMRALPYALEEQSAPSELKARLCAALANEQDAARHVPEVLPPPPARFMQRMHEGVWIETGFNGVAYKNLFHDHVTGYNTMLLRMAPDARFPSHRHGGYEECYVLQGDVSSGAVELFAGDYQRMPGGTMHQALHTKHGCLLLLVASEHNELTLS